MRATRWLGFGMFLLSCEVFAGAAFDLGSMSPWPLSGGQLRVCIEPTSDPSLQLSNTDYDDLRQATVELLNETWGRVPGLSFNESCGTSDPSLLALTLTNQDNWGVCGSGKGASCVIGASTTNLESFRRTLVHEVGHALGLHHEHQSPVAQQLCPREKTIHDGCQQCADGECSAQDYTDCFFVSASSPVVKLPTTGDFSQAGAKDRQLQREPDITARALTVYDPISLMGYCQADFGGAKESYNPTVYDLLAAEMLYSVDRSYGLACGAGCLLISGGVVVSNYGSVVSEWIGRGALQVPLRVPGLTGDVDSIAASQLPAGISTLFYTFDDPWNNGRHGSGTVERSDPAFAAIVSILAPVG